MRYYRIYCKKEDNEEFIYYASIDENINILYVCDYLDEHNLKPDINCEILYCVPILEKDFNRIKRYNSQIVIQEEQ